MKIVIVRIGDHYGPEYEEYIESKLGQDYDLVWVREPIADGVKLQWNKMYGMSLDQDEPICVIDIDLLLVGDYKQAFDYPIESGQFLGMPGWWRDTGDITYQINGGFFKYYPRECKYIYDKFMSNVDYWQEYYIRNLTTVGPVNGEQFFVEDHARERLDIITLPNSWVTRWLSDDVMTSQQYLKWQQQITSKYYDATGGNDYVFLGEFHPDIKIVHFTHQQNKPRNWKHINQYL